MQPGDTTRFGAPWNPLSQCVTVLRARTSRFGVVLRPAGTDLVADAACVVAIEAWMAAVGANSLEQPARYGNHAVLALSRSLALLGDGVRPDLELDVTARPEATPDAATFALAEYLAGWVESWGLDVAEVMGLAAGAIGVPGGPHRLMAMASVLCATATAPR
jgi:hypothetical protein